MNSSWHAFSGSPFEAAPRSRARLTVHAEQNTANSVSTPLIFRANDPYIPLLLKKSWLSFTQGELEIENIIIPAISPESLHLSNYAKYLGLKTAPVPLRKPPARIPSTAFTVIEKDKVPSDATRVQLEAWMTAVVDDWLGVYPARTGFIMEGSIPALGALKYQSIDSDAPMYWQKMEFLTKGRKETSITLYEKQYVLSFPKVRIDGGDGFGVRLESEETEWSENCPVAGARERTQQTVYTVLYHRNFRILEKAYERIVTWIRARNSERCAPVTPWIVTLADEKGLARVEAFVFVRNLNDLVFFGWSGPKGQPGDLLEELKPENLEIADHRAFFKAGKNTLVKITYFIRPTASERWLTFLGFARTDFDRILKDPDYAENMKKVLNDPRGYERSLFAKS